MAALALADEAIIWERQHAEPKTQYHAFCHYRDLGSARSMDKAWRDHLTRCEHVDPAEVGSKRAKNWQKLAIPWGWVQRCESFDREQDKLALAKMTKDRVDAAARHARMAQAKLQVLTVPSRAILDALSDPNVMLRMVDAAKKSSAAFIRLLEMDASAARALQGLVAVERLSLGMEAELITVELQTRSVGASRAGCIDCAYTLATNARHKVAPSEIRIVLIVFTAMLLPRSNATFQPRRLHHTGRRRLQMFVRPPPEHRHRPRGSSCPAPRGRRP